MDQQDVTGQGSEHAREGPRPRVIRVGQASEASRKGGEDRAAENVQRVLRAGERTAEQDVDAAEKVSEAAGQAARTTTEVGANVYRQALELWIGLQFRTLQRNSHAFVELPQSRGLTDLLNRQQLLLSNVSDYMQTSLSILQAFGRNAKQAGSDIRHQFG